MDSKYQLVDISWWCTSKHGAQKVLCISHIGKMSLGILGVGSKWLSWSLGLFNLEFEFGQVFRKLCDFFIIKLTWNINMYIYVRILTSLLHTRLFDRTKLIFEACFYILFMLPWQWHMSEVCVVKLYLAVFDNQRIKGFKVPISSKFLFSYLILYITQWTFAKETFDLDNMQSFFRSFKNIQICHHFGPPFAPVFP